MKRGTKITIGVLLVLGLLALFVIPMKTVTIRIDLPPPIPPKAPPRREPIILVMESDGRLTIEGKPTTLETLPRDLSARFAGVPKDEQRVMIRAAADISYDRFMAVLNSLQGHGWTKVGLINEDIHGPDES